MQTHKPWRGAPPSYAPPVVRWPPLQFCVAGPLFCGVTESPLNSVDSLTDPSHHVNNQSDVVGTTSNQRASGGGNAVKTVLCFVAAVPEQRALAAWQCVGMLSQPWVGWSEAVRCIIHCCGVQLCLVRMDSWC